MVAGQEGVDGTFERHRHDLWLACAVRPEEIGEGVALIDDDVVVHTVDPAVLQQPRHFAVRRPLEGDIGDPMTDPFAERVRRREAGDPAAFQDQQRVGKPLTSSIWCEQ